MAFQEWHKTFKDNNSENRNIANVLDLIYKEIPEKDQYEFKVGMESFIRGLPIAKRSIWWAPEKINSCINNAWGAIPLFLVHFSKKHNYSTDTIRKIWIAE